MALLWHGQFQGAQECGGCGIHPACKQEILPGKGGLHLQLPVKAAVV